MVSGSGIGGRSGSSSSSRMLYLYDSNIFYSITKANVYF